MFIYRALIVVIKEMQMKTTMRYYLTLVTMALSKRQ